MEQTKARYKDHTMIESRSQFPREYIVPEPSRTYGLGMPDVVYHEDMERLRRVLKTGNIGSFSTVKEWIDWNIHPAWMDEALEIAASHACKGAES